MSSDSIQTEQIDEIISTSMGIERNEFDDDTELGPDGLGVDSITIVEIAELIEMQMGVAISDEELDEFGGGTVGDLKEFVEGRTEPDA